MEVSCSTNSFVVTGTLVIPINFCAKKSNKSPLLKPLAIAIKQHKKRPTNSGRVFYFSLIPTRIMAIKLKIRENSRYMIGKLTLIYLLLVPYSQKLAFVTCLFK